MGSDPRVTLSDVAAVAGVSVSTASRALNGGGRISAATRQRVIGAARRLEFQPNALARSFALGRSGTVGILTQHAVGTWSAPIIVGASRYLGSQQHATLLYDADFDVHTLSSNIRKLQSRRIDSLLVIGDSPQWVLPSATEAFPVSVAYVFLRTTKDDDVVFLPDYVHAGRIAGEHLLEIGRRKIAYISASTADFTVGQRKRGIEEVLHESGIDLVASVTDDGGWSEEWGRVALTRLVSSGTDIDAVFCGNDQIAFGVVDALREHGRRVPDDVAVVGVDNWEGVIVRQGNRLTSVDPSLAALGAAAAKYVISGRQLTGIHLEPCSLMLGRSTMGEAAPQRSPSSRST